MGARTFEWMTFEMDIVVCWVGGIDWTRLNILQWRVGACVLQKVAEKDQEWKFDEKEEKASGKMRSLADMDKIGT